jgi:TetR/AcrR family transcriptional regulator, transcriptional repressor for nem operon
VVAHAERRARTPDETRASLLEAAFEQIFRHGFQAASLNAILARAGVTKGAMYHHFADKAALGTAVVDEVVRAPILDAYLQPLRGAEDPLSALQEVIRRRADDFTDESVALGCPLNNLAQEMSPLDERFRARVEAALEAWTDGFADALGRAREAGVARPDLDARGVASFLVAAIEGSLGMAKNARSVALLRSNLGLLADYLETLRA